MFDRPSDTWYIYMRPFRVALLLQMRNLQHTAYLQAEAEAKDTKAHNAEAKDNSTQK